MVHRIKQFHCILTRQNWYYYKARQHTSSGSCFTTGKFSCLTSADQSPLSHSVVHGPSVSLVSGTISMNSSLQESSVTSGGRLVDSVSSVVAESLESVITKKTISIRQTISYKSKRHNFKGNCHDLSCFISFVACNKVY